MSKDTKIFTVYDTHKFLFTLNHEGKIQDHTLYVSDSRVGEYKIQIKEIEIGASPVSFRVIDKEGKRHVLPFVKIKKVEFNGEIVWINETENNPNLKIIEGYGKEK